MTSKNISLTNDAYELLKKMKLGEESFSDTIKRLAKRRRLSDCAGLWADIPADEIKAITGSITELRKRAKKSLQEASS